MKSYLNYFPKIILTGKYWLNIISKVDYLNRIGGAYLMDLQALKDIKFSKICSFYIGEVHFLTTILPFLMKKLTKGSKVILFVDKEFHQNKLSQVISSIDNEFKFETIWQRNVVTYTVKTMKELNVQKYLIPNIKRVIEIMTLDCSDEGIVICVKKANDVNNELFKELEDLVYSLSLPIYLIRCYELIREKQKLLKVLSEHNYILNMTGIFEIKKVFPDINIQQLA